MKHRIAFAVTAAAMLLGISMPVLAQAVEWQRVHGDDEGEYFVDPASLRRDGDRVRVTMRLAPTGRGGVTHIGDYDFDCAGHTMAMLAARELGPQGEQLRAVIVPAERVRAETVYAGSGQAPMFHAVCPAAAALPEPPAMPAIVATPPGTAGRGCRETQGTRSCGAGSSDPNP